MPWCQRDAEDSEGGERRKSRCAGCASSRKAVVFVDFAHGSNKLRFSQDLRIPRAPLHRFGLRIER